MERRELDLVPGLVHGVYVYDGAHSLLAADAWKDAGPNIGKNGENLTISFLSMNRAALSERLLKSIQENIPHFAGEVLITDNGSTGEELDRLRGICTTLPFRTNIVQLGKNFGVAGGRNRTIPHVKTEWLMCLDNDIYFISDPLPQIQRDLATLGCHFMSLPLLEPDGRTLFARGGHLYVFHDGGHLEIGPGSACRRVEAVEKRGQPFLGTFLFGGACVLNKGTFTRAGLYDEAMFVGFEDVDLSIRLFQQGYKVGATSLCALIHDHPKPASDSDRDYEKERFSRNILHTSAQYLEAKHGFKIWSDDVDHWLDTRQRELGLETEVKDTPSPNLASALPKKPKIALIIDTDNWAFANIARQLERHLVNEFDFSIIPMDVIENIDQIFLMTEDCDVVHFFWREHLTLIGTPYFRSYAEGLGMPYETFHERFISSKRLSTSVYDHLLLDEKDLTERAHLYSDVLAGYTVCSEKLNTIYSNIPGYPKPACVIEDGVDLKRFVPNNLKRLQQVADRELVIGWVGNSKWASEIEDFKGVHTILKPAIEQLQNEGVRVKAFFADRQEKFIPQAQMPDYYSQIDVCVCASKNEGTPNPVLEAMACGVPIITTDVGIVPQAFGDRQKACILRERSIDALKEAILQLVNAPEQLPLLSSENLDQIRSWDWTIKARKFGEYFNGLLR